MNNKPLEIIKEIKVGHKDTIILEEITIMRMNNQMMIPHERSR